MTPLLLFLLGCAVTYLGTVSAAFNALMRLSLRIHAERTDRDDSLGRYLEDPRRFFVPARMLSTTLTVLAAALLARVTGLSSAGFPVLILSIVAIVITCEHLIPLLHRAARSRARARRAAAVLRRHCPSDEAADFDTAADRHEPVEGARQRQRPSRAANAGHARLRHAGHRHRAAGTARGGPGRPGARAAAQPRRLPRDDGARSHDAAARHHRDRKHRDRRRSC